MNPHFMALHAEDFLNAFHVLEESFLFLADRKANSEKLPPSIVAFGTKPTMGVAIVCLAFSVELHLKELLSAVSGKVPKEHKIAKLFEALPESIQKEIRSRHSITRFHQNEAAFDKELGKISDGFTQWRYAYESKSAVLRYNNSFATELIEIVRSISEPNRRQQITPSNP